MRRIHFLAVTTLVTTIGGCATLDYKIDGVVAENSAGGTYAFADFGKVSVDTEALILKPDKGDSVAISLAAIKANIKKDTADYAALLGPLVGSGGTADGNIEDLKNPWTGLVAPAAYLDSTGFIWAWGLWPFAGTKWVSAAAQGSTIMIQAQTSTQAYVLYVETDDPSKKAIVECLHDTSLQKELSEKQFVIVTEITVTFGSTTVKSCDFGSGVKDIDAGSADPEEALAGAIQATLEPIARAGGWTP